MTSNKDINELTLQLCEAPLTSFLKKFVPKAIVTWFGDTTSLVNGEDPKNKVLNVEELIETSKNRILKHIADLSYKLIKSRKLPSGKYYHAYGKQLKTPSSHFFPFSKLGLGTLGYRGTIDDEFSAKIKEWTEEVANN